MIDNNFEGIKKQVLFILQSAARGKNLNNAAFFLSFS